MSGVPRVEGCVEWHRVVWMGDGYNVAAWLVETLLVNYVFHADMRVDDDAHAASLASPSVCGDVCGDVCEGEPQPRPVRRQRALPWQTEGPVVVF